MSTARKARGASTPRRGHSEPPARGDARRSIILRALHSCVIAKGYSKTTLADIAEAADMYPSHLLYYFDGKESILEQYFQDVADKILLKLNSFVNETPQRQIELLANLFFAGEGVKKTELGFMFESFGVAVNDSVLREEKAELDRRCKAYLIDLFEHSPKRVMAEARDCAELAYAMLIGLRSAVYFDEQLNLANVRRLFHNSVRRLAGYTEVD